MTWIDDTEAAIRSFAQKHGSRYKATDRQLSASFEIGCFHGLIDFYESTGCTVNLKNLKNGEFKYLTTPAGNPSNFSYVSMDSLEGEFEIRQQVKIKSHIGEDIAFSPDITVLKHGAEVSQIKDRDYANGKRPFYTVSSKDVIAAHECKSFTIYPELMVSFIGMFITAHHWYELSLKDGSDLKQPAGKHLAPTLFVGGMARNLDLRMIKGLQKAYPINIATGLHAGTASFRFGDLNRITI